MQEDDASYSREHFEIKLKDSKEQYIAALRGYKQHPDDSNMKTALAMAREEYYSLSDAVNGTTQSCTE